MVDQEEITSYIPIPAALRNKLAGMYRGTMIITTMDLVKVKYLISNRKSLVHTSRLRQFKHPKDMSLEII